MTEDAVPPVGETTELCRALVEIFSGTVPENVLRHAESSLLNVVATAIGAAASEGVSMLVGEGGERGGRPLVPVLGRNECLDVLWAAIANGFAAHVDDFDDTHLPTMVHPGAVTMASVISMGTNRHSAGAQVLRAFALGCEVQVRLGIAMSPWHYDEGWYITGTCGVMGAAVAAGLLAGLDADGLCTALGLAASQTLGLRESIGTMGKAFYPGKAAANGILAVLLAERGFVASRRVLEATRGFLNVLSPAGHDTSPMTAGLGASWQMLDNALKAYPCDIVSHPAITSALEISRSIDPRQVSSILVSCHPLVAELTGNLRPTHKLEAQFSTAHGVAVALIDGAVGLRQYEDNRVNSEDVRSLRSKVTFNVENSFARDEAIVSVTVGQSTFESRTEHAEGSTHRSLSERALEQKVAGLVEPVLPDSSKALVDTVRGLAAEPDLGALLAVATGGRSLPS